MKKSSPISLFSFQDIVTSLTGIMIVIVLVITLDLVHAMAEALAPANQLPEIKLLKEEHDSLMARQEKLKEKLRKTSDPADLRLSLPELQLQIKRMEEVLAQQKDRKLALRNASEENTRKEDALKKMESELAQEKVKMTKLQEKQNALQKQYLRILEQKRKLAESQEKKRKMLRFEFSGRSAKTPILIECNGWGFRSQPFPDGTISTFGRKGITRGENEIPSLIAWLKKHSPLHYYPVFLFREKALEYHNELLSRLSAFNYEMGREIIGNSEVCIYEEN